MSDLHFLADDPIGATSEDALGRASFVDSAAAAIADLADGSESAVVALVGPWGSGKTSLSNLVVGALEGAEVTGGAADGTSGQWLIIAFNPWEYQDLASIQTGFFRELRAKMPKSWTGARRSIGELGHAIAPLGSIGAFLGFDASGAAAAVAKLIEGDTSVGSLRAEAEKSLSQVEQRILVVLDDLDRLDPEELLLVFKLIRLTGRLPNMHFLICYDETTLLDVLSRTGVVGSEDPRRGMEYIEKIVQLRLDVPVFRETQVNEYTNRGFGVLIEKGIAISDADMTRFTNVYHRALKRRFTSPRSVKRFYVQVAALYPRLHGEVDVADYLLLTWLRVSEPLVYEMVVKRRDELLGLSVEAREPDPSDLRREWSDLLVAAKVRPEHVEGVAIVVGELFPRFRATWAGRKYGDRDPGGNRVSNYMYFDRYFSFDVPDEDISDSMLATAFDEIVAGRRGATLEQFEGEVSLKASVALAKLNARFDQHPDGAGNVLIWLASRIDDFREDIVDPGSPRRHAQSFARQVFEAVEPSDRASVVQDLLGTDTDMNFIYPIYLSVEGWIADEEPQPSSDATETRELLRSSVARELERRAAASPFDLNGQSGSCSTFGGARMSAACRAGFIHESKVATGTYLTR